MVIKELKKKIRKTGSALKSGLSRITQGIQRAGTKVVNQIQQAASKPINYIKNKLSGQNEQIKEEQMINELKASEPQQQNKVQEQATAQEAVVLPLEAAAVQKAVEALTPVRQTANTATTVSTEAAQNALQMKKIQDLITSSLAAQQASQQQASPPPVQSFAIQPAQSTAVSIPQPAQAPAPVFNRAVPEGSYYDLSMKVGGDFRDVVDETDPVLQAVGGNVVPASLDNALAEVGGAQIRG